MQKANQVATANALHKRSTCTAFWWTLAWQNSINSGQDTIWADLVLDKMLLVRRSGLAIPRNCVVAPKLAACPLPTGPDEAAIIEQLQIFQCCRGSFAVHFLSHLEAPKTGSGIRIVLQCWSLAGQNKTLGAVLG